MNRAGESRIDTRQQMIAAVECALEVREREVFGQCNIRAEFEGLAAGGVVGGVGGKLGEVGGSLNEECAVGVFLKPNVDVLAVDFNRVDVEFRRAREGQSFFVRREHNVIVVD